MTYLRILILYMPFQALLLEKEKPMSRRTSGPDPARSRLRTTVAAIDRGLANIRKNYATSVQRGRFTQQSVDERLSLIKPTLRYDDFRQADMVIEAVFEGLALIAPAGHLSAHFRQVCCE